MDEHSDGSGPWGRGRGLPPKHYKKLFFPVLHSVLGAFCLSCPDLCFYITELKTEPMCLKNIFQTLTTTFTTLQNTIHFILTGLWHSGCKEQIRNHSSLHEQEEKHVVSLFIDTKSATETCVIFSEEQARSSTPDLYDVYIVCNFHGIFKSTLLNYPVECCNYFCQHCWAITDTISAITCTHSRSLPAFISTWQPCHTLKTIKMFHHIPPVAHTQPLQAILTLGAWAPLWFAFFPPWYF